MSINKVINFAPGPGKLPESVLAQAQKELLNFNNTGISIAETSHRSPEFAEVLKDTKQTLKTLLDIPDNFRLLFLQGGGQGQFAAVPLNLLSKDGAADYVVTGSWSEKSVKEASKYGSCNRVLPNADSYENIPAEDTWKLNPEADYLYYCENETIHGIEFPSPPASPGVPLVADMSSNILSRKIDFSKFGMIFAAAQKNIGPAGCTLVIIREDLLGKAQTICPSILDYTAECKADSILNTPPVFGIYMMGLVFKWVAAEGGVEEMERRSKQKSSLLYSCITESSDFYSCTVAADVRSRMNVCFRVGGQQGDAELEDLFVKEAKDVGIISVKGHRSVGGMRASLYNAISVDETQTLVDFMKQFQNKHQERVCSLT